MTATEETIAYYDGNAKKFIANTANIEFSALQKTFADMLPEGGRILDLGCGSGRDSLAFLKAGFAVDAVDGSAEMAKAASELTGLKVEHATFADFEPERGYDGIWACFTCRPRSCPQSSPNMLLRSSRAVVSTSASSSATMTACATAAGSPT